MHSRLAAVGQYLQNISLKKLLIVFGVALLVILGAGIVKNFTPLAEPVTAQTSPLPTTIPRYVVTSEFGRDRPGSDYNSFPLNRPAASDCQLACINDNNCAAYTYVRPGVQRTPAVCYLKTPAPASNANNCCVSGVKL